MANLIYKKMNEVMKDIKAVTKDQKNTAQGFKFRGIDQFVNALYPALTKHGVFMTTEVLKQEEQLKDVTRSNGKAGVDKHVSIQMKYTFHAEDGSSVSSSVPAEGLDSGDKATNKALSAALKYTLIQTFSIPTEDMAEADFESPEIGSSKTNNSLTVATNESNTSGVVTLTTSSADNTVSKVDHSNLQKLNDSKAKISTFRKRKVDAPKDPILEGDENGVATITSSSSEDWN